jgi:hypothetical protein
MRSVGFSQRKYLGRGASLATFSERLASADALEKPDSQYTI